MIEDKKIKSGPPKRDPTCYQLQRDIVIPAGTILRSIESDKFGCLIGIGLVTVRGEFSVNVSTANGDISDVLKKVTAA